MELIEQILAGNFPLPAFPGMKYARTKNSGGIGIMAGRVPQA